MQKYLIIRLSSIGDIVLTTPVVRCLKQQKPACELHYLTKQQFLPIVETNPFIDRIFTIQSTVDEVVEELKKENYDQIIDLHRNFRSIGLRKKLGVKSTTFPKLNVRKWLLVNFKIDKMPDIHIVDRYFEAVKNLGVSNDLKGLDYFIPKKDAISVADLPASHYQGFVALVIGGNHATKQLPAEKAIQLCRFIKFPIVILGGKADWNQANKIASSDPAKIFNSCGKFTLNQSASLVDQAKVVVTNDTGLMHVAAALGKRIISVWGNTVPQLGMYPYLPGRRDLFSIYEVKNLSCRPCSKIGFQKCPKKHFKCMINQDIQGMAEKVNEEMGTR